MKIRVTFNDGKKFSHYALLVFQISVQIAYFSSGLVMFSMLYINSKELLNGFIEEMLCVYLGI